MASGGKGKASAAAAGDREEHHGAPTLGDCEILAGAVDAFVRANASIESSVPVTGALEKMRGLGDLQEIFAAPIRERLFTMDSALHWALFLHSAPKSAVEGGDPRLKKFSEKKALALIADVYDLGMESAVWEHFEGSDDSDDGSSEDEEPGDEEPGDEGPGDEEPEPEPEPRKAAKSSSRR